jgi:hypothetical protein
MPILRRLLQIVPRCVSLVGNYAARVRSCGDDRSHSNSRGRHERDRAWRLVRGAAVDDYRQSACGGLRYSWASSFGMPGCCGGIRSMPAGKTAAWFADVVAGGDRYGLQWGSSSSALVAMLGHPTDKPTGHIFTFFALITTMNAGLLQPAVRSEILRKANV